METVTRTYPLPSGGSVKVTASGEGVEAWNILRPEVAAAFAESLIKLTEAHDPVHTVE